MNALTITESKRLVALEKTIEAGKRTFVEVGLALAEIRDAKLYKADYDTFEDYCREKWGFTKTYANNLIQGAAVIKELPENLTTMVATERQARALGKVEPEKRAGVLEKAAACGPVTSKSITEAAEDDPPRVKTYDQEFKGAFGGKLPEIKPEKPAKKLSKVETLLLDALDVQTANDGFIRDCIAGHECDSGQLQDAIDHLTLLSKLLKAYRKELAS